MIAPFVVSLALSSGAAAWGNAGHQTVGYVAQEFLSAKALSNVKTLLGSTFNYSLGVAATWADTVKYEAAYTWSAPLHFVDANDSPLTGQCSVSETRDCIGNSCILAAIANYTTRVVDTTLPFKQQYEALQFLDHFFGDIGQPLHVEAYQVGGNDIPATCSGYKSSNELHSVWDTGILTTNLNANYGSSVTTYANALITRIKSGSYKSLIGSWTACNSTTAPLSRRLPTLAAEIEESIARRNDLKADATSASITPLKCPLVWAQEANAYDCSYVFNYQSGTDLCSGSYYTNAIPIIDLQLAKQGYRLAAWLNALFD